MPLFSKASPDTSWTHQFSLLVFFLVTCSICFPHIFWKCYFLHSAFTRSIWTSFFLDLYHLLILLPHLKSCNTMELEAYFQDLFHVFINLFLARPCELCLRGMSIAILTVCVILYGSRIFTLFCIPYWRKISISCIASKRQNYRKGI